MNTPSKTGDPRIEQILNLVLQLAVGNLNERCPVSQKGDELDAIIGGLNMLAEELQYTANSRDQIMAELEKSQTMMKQVIETLPLRLFWRDKEGVYLGCNTLLAQDAGFETPEDIIGKSDYKMKWREQAERHLADDKQVLESGQPKLRYEELDVSPDGSEVYLELSKIPLKDSDGRIIGILGTYHDITDRKVAEANLRKLNEELEQRVEDRTAEINELSQMVEQSISSFMLTDLDANIKYVNAAFTTIAGYSRDEAIGRNPRILSSGKHSADFFNKMWKTISYGEAWRGEIINKKKNGDLFWEDTIISPIKSRAGEITGYAAIKNDITQRKEIELALKKSQERLLLAQKSANMGTWDWDINRNTLEWSETIESIFGIKPGEFDKTYEGFVACIHPDDLEIVQHSVKAALAGETEYDIDHRIVWPDGSIHWLRETGTVQRDKTGKPIQMLGIVQDVTSQKEILLELETRTKMLHTVIDSIGEPAFLIDTNGVILLANQALAKLLNRSLENVIGVKPAEILPPDLAKSRLEMLNKAMRIRKPVKFEDIQGETILDNTIYPVLNSDQSVDVLAVLAIDITERRKLETDLETLRRGIEQSPSSIVITNKEGKIEYVNPGFCHTTGYSSQEAIVGNPRLLKSGQHDASFYKEMWSVISAGNIWQGEICNKKKDGSLFWEQASISPVINDQGEITHYIAVKEDISEKKELHRLKEDIERIMRHDLKTPLNAIIGYPQLLLKSDLTERQQKMIGQMYSAGNTMLKIIESYLDMIKMEEGTYELNPIPIDLAAILKRVMVDIQIMANKKQVELELTVNQQTPKENDVIGILGEESLCYSMFANLLKNAVEASINNEMVNIDITTRSSQVDIKISNTGVVPADIRRQFFEKYVTAGKKNGTGLGTYSAKLMAEIQEGSIVMRSSEEQGTSITISMPA